MAKKINIEAETIEYKCHSCGTELTPENSREVTGEFSQTGLSALCIECEQKYFDKLAEVEGKSLALFHCCAAFDVPCKPMVLADTDFDNNKFSWILYIEKLAEAGEDRRNDDILSFFDGETNILRVFGRNFTEKDFAKYIKVERDKLANLPGTREQRDRWGTSSIWKGLVMTNEVYNDLDKEYQIRVRSFAGQTLTDQQEDTLRKVAKLNVTYSYLMSQGLSKMALDVQKMVDTMLASEQMRKKDEKPIEGFELMSQVVALEKAGLMEDGKFLPIDELQKVLFYRFIKGRKFDYTIDAVDGIIENIYKTMRQNADAYIPTELPEELEIEDIHGEFAEEETEEERKNKKFTNTINVVFEKKKRGRKPKSSVKED